MSCTEVKLSLPPSPPSLLCEEEEDEPELVEEDRLNKEEVVLVVEVRYLLEVKLLPIAIVLEAKNCNDLTNIAGTIKVGEKM